MIMIKIKIKKRWRGVIKIRQIKQSVSFFKKTLREVGVSSEKQGNDQSNHRNKSRGLKRARPRRKWTPPPRIIRKQVRCCLSAASLCTPSWTINIACSACAQPNMHILPTHDNKSELKREKHRANRLTSLKAFNPSCTRTSKSIREWWWFNKAN